MQKYLASSGPLDEAVKHDVQRELARFDAKAESDGREDKDQLQTERTELEQAVRAYSQFFANTDSLANTGVLNGRQAAQQWSRADFKRHYMSKAAKSLVRASH